MGIFGFTFLQVYGLIGKLFLNALTLVVLPLVVSSIITGTARMSSEGSFGTLGVKALAYFVGTSLLAVLLGLSLVLLIQPGVFEGQEAATTLINSVDHSRLAAIEAQSQGNGFERFEQILLKIVPSNILAAASQGQMIGLIFFSLVFGYFISKIDAQPAAIILGFWKGIFQIMMKITHLVMKALPIGVFGLVAKVVATTGAESIRPAAYFTFTVLLGLAIHGLVVLPLLLKFVAGVSPIAHYRAMAPALLTAFSTSSSAASLPVTMECVEKRANVSNRICNFMVPLGTSLSANGSALFICIASLFIAQVYGIGFSFITLFTVGVMTLLSSLGMAGIPSACLVGVLIVLHTLGLPADAIGLILAVERILDMCRTVLNVFGNSLLCSPGGPF